MFQHTITSSRVRWLRVQRREPEKTPFHVVFLHACLIQARKYVPIERLEQLRSQLSSGADLELSAQLEEVIGKLEPPDSASSSRRSSISSHVRCSETLQRLPADSGSAVTAALVLLFQESFNVLDCGIYRVISRRGSQSEEETSSLINPSMSEEERLKEFSFTQEEDPVDHGRSSCVVALSLYLTVCKRFYFKDNCFRHIFWYSYLFDLYKSF